MKKLSGLLFALLLIASICITSRAKAQSLPCQGADPVTGGCPTGGGGNNLPINNGIVYLLGAGAIIGIIALKKRGVKVVKA